MKFKLEESLLTGTPYMLRNDGALLQCGGVHPYIKYTYEMDDKKALENLFGGQYRSFLTFMQWFYDNTQYNGTKESIKSLTKSVVLNAEKLFGHKINVDNIIKFNYDTDVYSNDEQEIIEIFKELNNKTNQEFCRVRTSNMRYGGSSGDIYFRISSVGFNWFDLIWKLVMENRAFITTVTIVKDTQAFGGKLDYYKHKGVTINNLPTQEFINLSGNPIIEKLDFKAEINRFAYKQLSEGKSLDDAYVGMHPRYVNSNFDIIKEHYINKVFKGEE